MDDAPKSQAERALTVADEMAVRASQMRQMGFKELARWLDKNAAAARRWATQQEE